MKMNLGEKLRFLRVRAKLSQTQVGEHIGMDYSAIARYERGDVKPKIDVLQRIAGLYQMSLDQLYSYDPDEELRASDKPGVAPNPFSRQPVSGGPVAKVTILVELDGTPECLEQWIVRLQEFNHVVAGT